MFFHIFIIDILSLQQAFCCISMFLYLCYRMVKDFSDANNASQIKRLIKVLGQDLMSSTNPNVKNGALMGLSSVAVGLGKVYDCYLFSEET